MTNQNGEDLLKQLLRYYPPPQDDPRTSNGVNTSSHLKPLSTELTNSLVSLYFQNFHPLLPVLHKNYFLNRLSDTKKPISPLLLLAVCAIGSNYSDSPEARKNPNDPHTVGLNFYESAQEMVNQYLNVPRLSTATAFFLLGIFDAQRSFKGTIYVGMATTLAVTLRLHDHSSSDGRPAIEQEARKRLWWAIQIVNHLQCITRNRMLPFEDKHCTIGSPKTLGDDEVTEREFTEYFVHYVEITKIMYEVLERILNPDNGSENSMIELEKRLTQWKNDLPPFLQIDKVESLRTPNSRTTIDHVRVYLCLLYNYALIRMHIQNIDNDHSMSICAEAANTITNFMTDEFVNIINSNQFIIHCVLYAGYIHVRHINNAANAQLAAKSKAQVIQTISIFQQVIGIPSLHFIHSATKHLIAIFACQLENTDDIDEETMNIVKTALELVSPENRSSKSISGGRQVLPEQSQNQGTLNVRDDNNPTNARNEQSGAGMELLAHTAATRSPEYPSAQQPFQSQKLFPSSTSSHSPIDPSTSTVTESTPSPSYAHYPSPQHQQFRRDAPNLSLNTSPTSTVSSNLPLYHSAAAQTQWSANYATYPYHIQHQAQSSISQTDPQTLSSPNESTLMDATNWMPERTPMTFIRNAIPGSNLTSSSASLPPLVPNTNLPVLPSMSYQQLYHQRLPHIQSSQASSPQPQALSPQTPSSHTQSSPTRRMYYSSSSSTTPTTPHMNMSMNQTYNFNVGVSSQPELTSSMPLNEMSQMSSVGAAESGASGSGMISDGAVSVILGPGNQASRDEDVMVQHGSEQQHQQSHHVHSHSHGHGQGHHGQDSIKVTHNQQQTWNWGM
ncbi:4261_t:CDS:2 [Paraglomus occultum]|uniref:4261_t:CDS:1 n=1 Tax=Paraglomus occultum TaxID=144539 RepID=A0A9N9FNW7_9GLOM|nr:4261_t:CDS:2 [Paraglomus occultum]